MLSKVANILSVQLDFKNVTSGNSLSWFQPLTQPEYLSYEDAFEMLMKSAPSEIKSTQKRFESMTKDLFGEDFMDQLEL